MSTLISHYDNVYINMIRFKISANNPYLRIVSEDERTARRVVFDVLLAALSANLVILDMS